MRACVCGVRARVCGVRACCVFVLAGRALGKEVSEFAAEAFEPGSCLVFDVAHHVQSVLPDIRARDCLDAASTTPVDDKEVVSHVDVGVREWIYFHHVYSKSKRKSMLQWAEELCLTGFVMVGKPGLAMVEGSTQNVKEFHMRVFAMNWQKATTRLLEVSSCAALTPEAGITGHHALWPTHDWAYFVFRKSCAEEGSTGESIQRSFSGFQELHLGDAKRPKHPSLSALQGILQRAGLGDRFRVVFKLPE